jgi:carbonic anhydrase
VLDHLKVNNRASAARMVSADVGFFKRLASQQAPEFLWIGCADSRVPANEIGGLDPGEPFVHRTYSISPRRKTRRDQNAALAGKSSVALL